MKFLIDENVHRGLFFFLKEKGYDVKLCPKGITNGAVFRFSLDENRILITRDSDFLKNELVSSKHSGIIILRISPEDLESQKLSVLELLKNTDNFEGKIICLFSDRSELQK
jgi:predicted nuclease of predicted toxin-antitoxin system